CQSMQASALDVTQGFAPKLLDSGVPAVIGMQVTVLDDVAVQFARDFYMALADNRPVDAALSDARQLARGTKLRRKADLGIPVCYLRTGTGQILTVQLDEQIPLTVATWKPWLRKRAKLKYVMTAIVGFITLVGTLVGVFSSLTGQGVLQYVQGP